MKKRGGGGGECTLRANHIKIFNCILFVSRDAVLKLTMDGQLKYTIPIPLGPSDISKCREKERTTKTLDVCFKTKQSQKPNTFYNIHRLVFIKPAVRGSL